MPVFIDYTGKTIGRLVFLSWFYEGKKRHWNVECACGNELSYRTDYISTMKNKGIEFECTECQKDRITGVCVDKNYGRLTVLCKAIHSSGIRGWLLRCACGVERVLPTGDLMRGSGSCGCFSRKLNSKWANTTEYPPTHGFKKKNVTQYQKSIYRMRAQMLRKCYDKEFEFYSLHGAKGQTVCELWRNGATDFYSWCLKNGYKKSYTICLKRGKKEYSPQNCFLESKSEFFSKKNSKPILWKGKKLSISQWASILGCSIACLSERRIKYRKYGLDKVMDLSWRAPRNKKE